MGSSKPTRHDIAAQEFPVRLTLAIRGSRHDFHNRQINEFLQRARWRHVVVPCALPSGRRGAFLYLPHIGAAMEVMLHCPAIELVSEPYQGPVR